MIFLGLLFIAGSVAGFWAMLPKGGKVVWAGTAPVLDVRLDADDQSLGIEVLGSEDDARAWLDRAAQARGFTSVIPDVVRLK